MCARTNKSNNSLSIALIIGMRWSNKVLTLVLHLVIEFNVKRYTISKYSNH